MSDNRSGLAANQLISSRNVSGGRGMDGVLLAVLIIGGCVAYGVIGVLVGRKITNKHVAEGHNDVLVPIFLAAGVIYAVLLGFIVVAVWESYDGAHANVAEEAAMLAPLYRQTTVMAPDKAAAMQHLLRDYVENVVHDEWPIMRATGKLSEKARKDTGDIFRVYATLNPSDKVREFIDAQFLSTFSAVLLDRNKRLFQASEELSWVIWLGVIGGAAIIVGMTFFLYMDRPFPHMAMVGVMAG
jgi:hypothetical protein